MSFRDSNERVADEMVEILSEPGALYASWKGERDRAETRSIEEELRALIVSYLPRHHKAAVFLAKDGFKWVPLDTMEEYHVTTWDLYYHLFERMEEQTFGDEDFLGSFLSKLETYPCVHGVVANERYICWCLEFASGNVDVAWYVVDMLSGWSVRRIPTEQPERLISIVPRKNYFLLASQIFSVVVDVDHHQVMLTSTELTSGLTRYLDTLEFDTPVKLSSSHLLVTPVFMTANLVWLVLYHHDPYVSKHQFKGNLIYDCKEERVVGRIESEQLLAYNVVPTRDTTFFLDGWGFFIVHSISHITWVKMDGIVVTLESSQCGLAFGGTLFSNVAKLDVFCGEMYLVMTKEASHTSVGGHVSYLSAKCGVFEFVSRCCRAHESRSSFEWPELQSKASRAVVGSWCLC